jgi:beta-glucosidase
VSRGDFPPDFLWGVATAAYQVEGAAAEDGRGPSIWDVFSHTPGRTMNGDTGDVAVDHYHRFAEDVAIMRELGVNAYRFSLSWSRILPEGVGRVNDAGIRFYRRLGEELRAAGIMPVATLYHWDLPQALQERGGWLDERSAGWFAEYAAVAKDQLGDLITNWATLNEPWCSAFLGHSSGEHAPGMTDPGSAYVAAHNLLRAHNQAMAVLRSTNRQPGDQAGIVLNLIPALPASEDPADARAAAQVDTIQVRLFADAAFKGVYPEEVLGFHERFGVAGVIDPDEISQGHHPVDFLGLNYYNVNRISYREGAPMMRAWPGAEGAVMATPPGRLTEMGWGVEPEGLTWILERVAREYPPVPIMICENGAAYRDDEMTDGVVDDYDRIAYLESHIAAMAEAMRRGVDVRGYFVWTLMDNFEWSHGYDRRFGIVHVDRPSLTRTLKASGKWYREFLTG